MESFIVGVKHVTNGLAVTLSHFISPDKGVGFETFTSLIRAPSEEVCELLFSSLDDVCFHSAPFKGYVKIDLEELKKRKDK